MRTSESRLVLVFLLIGWKSGASFFNQSCSVNAKPIAFRHSNENRSINKLNIRGHDMLMCLHVHIALLNQQTEFGLVLSINLLTMCLHHLSGQNVVDSWGTAEWVYYKFWPLWWSILVVNKSTDNAKHHSMCFLPQCQHRRKCFFRAQAEKGIDWHIDQRSIVWTLISNGKLANQIARLVSIVVYLYNNFLTGSYSNYKTFLATTRVTLPFLLDTML